MHLTFLGGAKDLFVIHCIRVKGERSGNPIEDHKSFLFFQVNTYVPVLVGVRTGGMKAVAMAKEAVRSCMVFIMVMFSWLGGWRVSWLELL